LDKLRNNNFAEQLPMLFSALKTWQTRRITLQ
jgi:hypothetical protein